MDRLKIGIPRSLFYYYYGPFWNLFLKKIGFDVIISPNTSKEIIELGNKYSYDEMCLSLKNYIGHVFYLKDKCDYILIPRIANFGINDQTCTNFLSAYDIVNNLINSKIINYNIDLLNKESELKGMIEIGIKFGVSKNKIIRVYNETKKELKMKERELIKNNLEKLKSKKTKILIVGHPYNIYDEYIGKPIIKILRNMNIEIIYSDLFDKKKSNIDSKKLSKTLYWKYNKENIGCIPSIIDNINGIIFITTFPCGPDSLVNELVIRKIKKPTLNLIIDDLDSTIGIETRLESFIDILERGKIC